MINKRLLIKNLLAYNDENSFYDKKRKITLSTKEGKAKFLKHVCALSNSNPNNKSYIIIGVQDKNNKIKGVDFFDDSKIQNLINAYLENPPIIQYENVPFPRLPRHKVVGLVTIHPTPKVTSLKRTIWKYVSGKVFYRRGSTSMATLGKYKPENINKATVNSLEKNARNNIKLMLDGVCDFFNNHDKEHYPTYQVFNEQFVLCWAGNKKVINNKTFYSRVDIELINEQIKLFYSSLDEVKIEQNKNSFIITEYVFININKTANNYPLEKTVINFKQNGEYDIVTELLFKPPQFNKVVLYHVLNASNLVLEKLKKQITSSLTLEEIEELPTNYLVCILNHIPTAYESFLELKPYLKKLENKTAYIRYKDMVRVLRKVKYE